MNAPARTALALLAALWSAASLAEGTPLFERAPDPDALADILFPEPPTEARPATRSMTRSIVLDDEVPAAPSPNGGANDGANGGGAPDAAFGLRVGFAFGEASLLPEAIPDLDAVGEMMKLERARGQAIVIEGHTDAVGTEAYNQKLSELRALAVRRYLVSVHGIEVSRLHPVGRGESALRDAADPASAENRRVEFRRLDREEG